MLYVLLKFVDTSGAPLDPKALPADTLVTLFVRSDNDFTVQITVKLYKSDAIIAQATVDAETGKPVHVLEFLTKSGDYRIHNIATKKIGNEVYESVNIIKVV
jgi:hypothetical protein